MNETKEIYTINLLSNNRTSGTLYDAFFYYDWNTLPDREYIIYVRFMTSGANLQATLANPSIYMSCFENANQYNVPGDTHNRNGYMCTLIPDSYYSPSHYETDHDGDNPLFMYGRPNQNIFNVKWLNSDADTEYAPFAGALNWICTITFKPYKNDLKIYDTINYPKPVSVYLNSLNGTVVNTNSYISYYFDWGLMLKDSSYIQKWKMEVDFLAKVMNLNQTENAVLTSNLFPSAYNFQSGSVGAPNSEIIGPCLPRQGYTNRSNLFLSGATSAPIILPNLPSNNIFYIKLVELGDLNTLFTS